MLEKTNGLGLDQLVDHVAEDGSHSVESLVCVANVRQPGLVQEDLLNDEDGDSLGQFGTSLHDAQAQGNDFRGQEEVDDGGVIILLGEHETWLSGGHLATYLDQCSNNSERSEA